MIKKEVKPKLSLMERLKLAFQKKFTSGWLNVGLSEMSEIKHEESSSSSKKSESSHNSDDAF